MCRSVSTMRFRAVHLCVPAKPPIHTSGAHHGPQTLSSPHRWRRHRRRHRDHIAGLQQRAATRSHCRLERAGQRTRHAPLDPGARHPRAALAQSAVVAGGPERAGRDHALHRPQPPAARDRPVLAPDDDEPGHVSGTARPGREAERPARRHHLVPRGRVHAHHGGRASHGSGAPGG